MFGYGSTVIWKAKQHSLLLHASPLVLFIIPVTLLFYDVFVFLCICRATGKGCPHILVISA